MCTTTSSRFSSSPLPTPPFLLPTRTRLERFSFAPSLSGHLVFRLSVTVLPARAPYRDSRQQLTTIRPSSAILVAFRSCRWCNVVAAWCRECQLKFLLDFFQRDLHLSSSIMILECRNRSTRIKGKEQAIETSNSRVYRERVDGHSGDEVDWDRSRTWTATIREQILCSNEL